MYELLFSFNTEATPLYGGAVPDAAASVPIWLDNVQCNVNHDRLFDCNHNGLGINNCGHNEDVGVSCQESGELFQYAHCCHNNWY